MDKRSKQEYRKKQRKSDNEGTWEKPLSQNPTCGHAIRALLQSFSYSCPDSNLHALSLPTSSNLFPLSFTDKALLCNPSWPQSHDPPASSTQVLVLHACVAMTTLSPGCIRFRG